VSECYAIHMPALPFSVHILGSWALSTIGAAISFVLASIIALLMKAENCGERQFDLSYFRLSLRNLLHNGPDEGYGTSS
jgi:hypothetical protein